MKILLAEDEPDIQLITQMALEDVGWVVQVVSDGQEALQYAQNEAFDVVLLDVMMPRIDGFTTCAFLQQDPKTKDIPVIFLTAKSQELEVRRGLEIGACGYIIKPFDVFGLADRIVAILKAYKN